jgi:hypothetical protein
VVNTILLSQDDCYVDKDGNLPARPYFDKELLYAFCKGQSVSLRGYDMLPPSIQQVVNIVDERHITAAITIPEIDAHCDILIVVRSNEHFGPDNGKKFMFDKFKPIVLNGGLEIWSRK